MEGDTLKFNFEIALEKIDILTFTTIDAGTIWYGFAAGADMG